MVKLASAPGQTPQHATTILFTDIVGSSQYFVSRGNDAGMAMIERHNRLLFPLIASAGGRVVKTIGDAIFATFEDPAQAVGCAWAMQDTLKRANAEVSNEDHLDVRMGLHYGMVFEKENDAFGDAVNMAQRVQSKATGGQVLLSRSVRDLVRAEPQIESRSLGAIELKGSPEPVEVFELNSAPPLRAASPAHRILAQALTSIALVAALVAGATSWRGHRKSAVENPQPNPQRAFAKVMLRRWDSRGRLSELALGQEDILAGDQFQLVYKALEAHHLYAAYFDSVKGEYELIFPTRDSLEPVSPAGDVLIPKGDLHFFIDQGPDSQSLLFVVSKEPLRLVEDQRNAPRPSGSALRQAFEEIRSHGQAVCQWKQDSPQWAALECDSNAKITWVELPIGPH